MNVNVYMHMHVYMGTWMYLRDYYVGTITQAQLDSVTRNMRREISCLQGEVSDLERENTKLKVAKKLFDLEKANFEVSFVNSKTCTTNFIRKCY